MKYIDAEKIILQFLEPLKERRDYAPGGLDILEQNAVALKNKKLLPKDLEIIFKKRTPKHAIIKRCPKKDQDERPGSEQQWCLYTKDQDRLLGRHPTKEKALAQERVVQIHKHKN